MALVLHKILSAVRTEENILSGISKIERYSAVATSKIINVREFASVKGVMHINGKPVEAVSSQLSMGFTSSLRDVYKIDNIPKSLELRSIEDVKLRPSFTVGENIRFAENRFKPQLSEKLDTEAKKIMSSTDLKDEITPAVVERNPVLKNIFNNLSGKTMRTVGGTLITIGIGIAAVCAVVNEHRNRLTACTLYYYRNNQLRRCTILTCTCKKVACQKDCNYCSPEILKKYLPADMLVDNCGDFKEAAGCAKCPSENYNKVDISDDNTLRQDNIEDSSFVRCQRPDFFEALSDLFGGVSEDLLDIVKGSLNGVSWLVSKLPYIILAAIIGTIIIIIISIFSKFKSSSSSAPPPPRYEPLTNEDQDNF